ncbi:MAG: hypothetical protein GZ091_14995, partial [Paludibacter sp.]|nr:hypothetical protein [Paludibacter sp.]
MVNQLRIIIVLFSIVFVSCSQIPTELQTAEALLKTKPDSVLSILQHLQPEILKSESNRALYGLLLFQALDRNNQTLQPDSIINFSVNYYQKNNYKRELGIGYYYKARLYKRAQRFDEAT